MDDYLSKQTEFKLWLTEEKHKTVNDIKSPKTKAYFKSFVKLWNKRKLAQKYYRGTVSCETPPNPAGKQRCSFLSLVDSPFPNTVTFPQTIDLSHEGSILSDSPFSTFGKSPCSSGINKTPGSGHDLLDLKRKAIFNNMGKENADSDRQSDHNSDDQIIPIRKSASSSQSSCESTSGSLTDSPRSSKSSTSKKEKDENLYKVTVLSWTSKGELKVRPQQSPDLAENKQESLEINSDILSKHLTSHEYTTIEEHNTSIPYKDVQDAVSEIHDPTYCVIGFPTPGYAEPFDSRDKTDICIGDKPGNASSIEDLYAVPIKKKKSGDQSETISLTSNESATHLDRKVSNNMEKLSDIISSGSDLSITSGSSESLNHNYLTIPGQDGMGKASSAPELSTILESDSTKLAEKSYDEQVNFTNVTAINITCLNNSYLDGGNSVKPAIMNPFNGQDQNSSRFSHLTSFAASTPDRKRNLSDPSKHNTIGHQINKDGSTQDLQAAKRTLSDPTTASPSKMTPIRNVTPRSSLPPPPIPPVKDYPTGSPSTPGQTFIVKSPGSDSWPTPPPCLEQTSATDTDCQHTPEAWPTPPTPYDLCGTEPIQTQDDTPPPPLPPTPDSVFEGEKLPTPPPPQEIGQANKIGGEQPELVTADFLSKTNQSENKPPVMKITKIDASDSNDLYIQDTKALQNKENMPEQSKTNPNKQNILSERQVSTTSIERFETDIDSVIDNPTCDKENIQTKKRLVLETVV